MADENGEATQEVVQPESGQPEQVSTEAQQAESQPQKPGEMVTRKDFQQMQSILDRQIAASKKENELLRQQLQEMQLSSAPEEQREFLKVQQELEAVRAQNMQFQRENALRQLSSEYGVPYENLTGAQSPEEAWGIALTHMKQQMTGQVPQAAPGMAVPPQNPQPVTTPFVTPQQQGGGSKARDWDAELKAATDAGRPDLYIRLLREQEAEGR